MLYYFQIIYVLVYNKKVVEYLNIRIFDENLSAEIYRDVPEMTDRRLPKIIHVVVSEKQNGCTQRFWCY